jgi:hypothetical protein
LKTLPSRIDISRERSSLRGMSTPTPRAIALLKAAALAADTASRSKDTRFHLEAQVIKHQL